MMNGIDVKYSLSSKYFEIGESYKIHLDTNNYKIGLLVDYTEQYVTFKILEKGDIVDLTLTVDQLRFNTYDMIKMIPDYKNGKFSNI